MKTRGSALSALVAVALVWWARPGATAAGWALKVDILASPAGPGSAQPQLNVHDDWALVSWVEQTGERAALKFAERTATGWAPPRTAATGSNWFVNWADVPSVVRLADGSLAAHWLEKTAPGTYAYDVRVVSSHDDGITWTPPVSPHHDGSHNEHGFASLFQAPGDGGLGLVWLDGRSMQPMKDSPAMSGAMALRGAIFDRKGVQRSEVLIDDRVCECCPTATAVTSDGPIVAFRNRTEDEIRDIYVSRLVDGRWAEPIPVNRDNWKINACPVNGPALSANSRNVALAWFTATGNEGHVFVAFSDDAGKSFGPPVRVDEVSAIGRVDVELLPDSSAVVSWIEFASERSQFRIRRVDRNGSRSESVSVAGINSGRSSGYPRLARRGDELLFAWTDPQVSRVMTATAKLPTK